MRLCVVGHKQVWRSPGSVGAFATDGGTTPQIEAIGSLFDATEWIVCLRTTPPDSPGIPIPSESIRVVPLMLPRGSGGARKLFLATNAGYYLARMAACMVRADAVHAVVPGDIGMLGMLLALALRKPLFVRYCGAWPDTPQTSRMARLCKQTMVRHAGGRNVMFATGLGETPPDGPSGRVRWIFSTSSRLADVEALAGAGARRERVPGLCRVLFTGRLSPEKGLLNLLEAIARLEAAPAAGRCRYQLTLAGHGPQMGTLRERTAALGIQDRVRFTGLLDRAGVHRELGAADLFVLPSLTEGFPNALTEAMAAGIPAVASAVGAVPKILALDGTQGWVVPPGDVDALVAAIGAAAADPARAAAIGKAACLRARDWTLESWAGQIGATLAEAWGRPLKGSLEARRAAPVS